MIGVWGPTVFLASFRIIVPCCWSCAQMNVYITSCCWSEGGMLRSVYCRDHNLPEFWKFLRVTRSHAEVAQGSWLDLGIQTGTDSSKRIFVYKPSLLPNISRDLCIRLSSQIPCHFYLGLGFYLCGDDSLELFGEGSGEAPFTKISVATSSQRSEHTGMLL